MGADLKAEAEEFEAEEFEAEVKRILMSAGCFDINAGETRIERGADDQGRIKVTRTPSGFVLHVSETLDGRPRGAWYADKAGRPHSIRMTTGSGLMALNGAK